MYFADGRAGRGTRAAFLVTGYGFLVEWADRIDARWVCARAAWRAARETERELIHPGCVACVDLLQHIRACWSVGALEASPGIKPLHIS